MSGSLLIAAPFHLLLQSPTQDGELDSASNWQLDPAELASKFTSRTKALILNTPNNPVGKVPERPPFRDPSRLGSSPCYVTDLLHQASVSSSVKWEGNV